MRMRILKFLHFLEDKSFNDTNHNSLTLKRTDTNHGILIYRQNFTGIGTVGDANINNARLIATLGQKELENKNKKNNKGFIITNFF